MLLYTYAKSISVALSVLHKTTDKKRYYKVLA